MGFTGSSPNKNFEILCNPINHTVPDLNLLILDDRADFAIASSSNNKFYSMFDFHTRRWLIHVNTNNNTVNGASLNWIVSANDTGIYITEDFTHVIVIDQAVGTFINTQIKPFLADRTFAMRYHMGDLDIVIKGFALGITFD